MGERLFRTSVGLLVVLFTMAPIVIALAPYESTMGLVQKIFYFHVPSWFVMFSSAFVCGICSAIYLFSRKGWTGRVALAACELTVLFGLIGLVTGPLWARRAWGVWWQWDARLTTALILWMVFVAYLLVRRYGGPGSDKLAAVMGMFGMAIVPFVYWSVNVWRTVHPTTNVVPTLGPGMRGAFWLCSAAFLLLYVVVLVVRTQLETQRARLEHLYLMFEE